MDYGQLNSARIKGRYAPLPSRILRRLRPFGPSAPIWALRAQFEQVVVVVGPQHMHYMCMLCDSYLGIYLLYKTIIEFPGYWTLVPGEIYLYTHTHIHTHTHTHT